LGFQRRSALGGLQSGENMKRSVTVLFLLFVIINSANAQAIKARGPKSDAEILWDVWGVPHIFAPDESSAFQAFGWRTRVEIEQHL
jgi:acyl-homoserine lactone acylase PvdQ